LVLIAVVVVVVTELAPIGPPPEPTATATVEKGGKPLVVVVSFPEKGPLEIDTPLEPTEGPAPTTLGPSVVATSEPVRPPPAPKSPVRAPQFTPSHEVIAKTQEKHTQERIIPNPIVNQLGPSNGTDDVLSTIVRPLQATQSRRRLRLGVTVVS
jgi:hypothetical protein